MRKDIRMHNGVLIPNIGFGTWLIDDDMIGEAFDLAIKVGYRHFDSAQAYGNEKGLGKAIRNSSLPRQDLFITSKVKDIHKSYDSAKKSIEGSLNDFGLQYLDLMLIHCPTPWDVYGKPNAYRYEKENLAVWQALSEFYEEKKIRAIGVSNFSIADLKNIMEHSNIKPMVNQIPVYIGNTNQELIDFCQHNDIVVEAYSPIAHGNILGNEIVKAMADKYHCSVPQLCIAYVLQLGLVAIPKATYEEHMRENFSVDFAIGEEDLENLKKLKLNIGW